MGVLRDSEEGGERVAETTMRGEKQCLAEKVLTRHFEREKKSVVGRTKSSHFYIRILIIGFYSPKNREKRKTETAR